MKQNKERKSNLLKSSKFEKFKVSKDSARVLVSVVEHQLLQWLVVAFGAKNRPSPELFQAVQFVSFDFYHSNVAVGAVFICAVAKAAETRSLGVARGKSPKWRRQSVCFRGRIRCNTRTFGCLAFLRNTRGRHDTVRTGPHCHGNPKNRQPS